MLKKLAQCLGLASLILLENYNDFLAGGGDARMHVPHPLTGVVLANVADILLLTLLLCAVLVPLERTRVYPLVRLLLVMAIPLYFVDRLHSLLPFALPRLFLPAFAVVWIGALLLLFLRFRTYYAPAMLFASRLSAAFAVFALFSIAQLLWLTLWTPGPHQIIAPWSAASEPPRQHPRLIWIVFDELSYNQVFEHRAPGLELPSFDRLGAESTVYTNVQPIGLHTVSILPSLLAGKVVDDYRFRWRNRLDLHFTGIRGWHPVTGQASIFGDAQQAGWRTSAVGWYNPYCTIYRNALDECFSANQDKIEGPMAQDKTLLQNVSTPLMQLGRRALSPAAADRFQCDYDIRQRLLTFADLEQKALGVLRDDQADLVFLHLPIPHSPSIWSRRDRGFTTRCGSSYLDNLALTDLELGKILTILEASSRWPQTSLIVQGDHSWRVPLWDGLPTWTPEDSQVSHHLFDTRPAVIIHRPAQTSTQADSSPWPLLNVHDLVEATWHTGPPQKASVDEMQQTR